MSRLDLRKAVSTFRGHRVPHMDLIGRRRLWFALSGLFVLLSVTGLLVRELNFSIAFTGGSLLELENRSGASVQDYQRVMARFDQPDARVEILGGDEVNIRTESLTEGTAAPAPTPSPTATPDATATASPTASPDATPSPTASPDPTASPSPTTGATATPSPGATPSPTPAAEPTRGAEEIRAALARVAGVGSDEVNVTDVGPTWGSTISRNMLRGLVVFLILVTFYITLRFEWKMALGAIVALGHDLMVTAGIYALVGREVTPETIIAVLTILGYSLYDTVVIFDKVKENTESSALLSQHGYSGVVNLSLNQTFMRSVNTSLVVLFPIGALLLFGGDTLKDFAFALFVGVASGTYSSIFVASPILALLKEREPRLRQISSRVRAREERPGLRAVPDGGSSARPAPAPAETADRQLEPATARSPQARGAEAGTPRPRPSGTSKRKKSGRPQGKQRKRRR